METQTIKVEGMTCEHCIKAITKAVTSLNGINDINVNLNEKTVTIEYEKTKISLDEIKEKIVDQGYDIV